MSLPSTLRDGWGEVATDRGQISFLLSGASCSGPPLVLLPSLGGGARHWGVFGARLAAERRTIALDPPGFGRSSAPPTWLSTRVLAEEVLSALDSLSVSHFDLFGCSLGALVATEVALLAPERIEKLVLASAAARGRDFAPRQLRRAVRLVRDFVASPHPKPALARDIAGSVEPGAPPPPSQRPVAGASWSRARVLHFLSAVLTHDASRELAQLTMPVLVLYGEGDLLLDAAAQQRLLERLTHAQLHRLPGVGHDVPNEAPGACADVVLPFYASAERPEAQRGLRA